MRIQDTTQPFVSTPPTVDDALALARVMPIIPLRPFSKTPRVLNWQQRASTNPDTIKQWWHMWPASNVGHVIGRSRLVIDVDPRHGGEVGWKNLLARHGDLPATWRVWTGRQDGGFHLYFSIPDAVQLPEATDLDQGVEVFGHRHLLVVPPSTHPDTGKAYQWDAAHNPFTLREPAAAPEWLSCLLLDTHRKRSFNRAHGKRPGMSEAVTSGKVAGTASFSMTSKPPSLNV